MDLVIRGGRVYSKGRLSSLDIWIKDGAIAALGGYHHAHERLNGAGLLVLPGAIDAHVHFREPGPTYKEDWFTGSLSAIAGGVTTVVEQPNTDPRTTDRRSFMLKHDLARSQSVVDYCINGGPGNLEELSDCGVRAIGEIFTYEHSDSELYQILNETNRLGLLPTVHAEDKDIIERGTAAHAQELDPDAYSKARHREAEIVALEKVVNATDKAHICHISTKEGLEIVKNARNAKKEISCEVAPHHLLFNRRDYLKLGSRLKMNPPLRDQADNDALWQGLRDGSIDLIASDHAPHLPEEKREDIWIAPPGVPGVETTLPLMLSAVKRNIITLDVIVEAFCTRPAKLMGLENKGEIAVGKDADIVLIDTKVQRRIKADRLHSRAEWTPYEGMTGIFPTYTLIRGVIVYESGLCVKPGYGKLQAGRRLREGRSLSETAV